MILSCDPGISGAFCWLQGDTLEAWRMPTQTKRVNGQNRDAIDEHAVFDLMAKIAMLEDVKLFALEQVNGIKGQGAGASFSFGCAFAYPRMAAIALGLRTELIPPATWKGAMKAPKEKDGARRRASDLFPAYRQLWALAKDDGIAEAAMLAKYAERLL